jgi:iron complex transport system ATP-binding protein
VASLVARGISAGYGSREVLRGVDFSVSPGEVVSVLGPNGAGKSTLLRALAGTLPVSTGSVELFGRPLAELTRQEVARRLAVVPQDAEVAFGFRVDQVVMMGRAPHQSRLLLARSSDHEAVGQALKACDLEGLRERSVAELSGGERRRVGIARALAQEPEVLLMDEPTAHLDLDHATQLYELVRQQVAQRQVACVIVMHDLTQAARWSDRATLMKMGEVRAQGPVDEVLSAELLAETFGLEVVVGTDPATGQRYFLPN